MKKYTRPEIKVITLIQSSELANQFVENDNTVGLSAPNIWWPKN